MSLYAIGDIQGCHAEFCELLSVIGFNAAHDRLWLVGDLVNRGPDSLGVLREVKALGDAAVTVLGNHDFHLLTIARGHRRPHAGDTLDDVLAAADRDELVHWLQTRPLVVAEGPHVLVHAGLLPHWTVAKAAALSREVEHVLAGPDADAFLGRLYGNEPRNWSDDLEGFDRWRVIVNACTRLRFCTPDGTMDFREKRGLAYAPSGMRAWFEYPHRKSATSHVVCGHWSTLGLVDAFDVTMLDTGCVWGRSLTAIRLDDRRIFQVPSRQPVPAGHDE